MRDKHQNATISRADGDDINEEYLRRPDLYRGEI